MTRIEVVSNSQRAAEELAAALSEAGIVDIVRAGALAFGYRPDPGADVVIGLEVLPPPMPASGPKVVLVSKDGRFERRGSVRASLRLDALPGEIAAAAVAAHAGLYALTAEQLHALPQIAEPDTGIPDTSAMEERLTPRELQILQMMADGASNKEIAAELGISNNTVKFHAAHILGKLGAVSRAEAVRLGIRRGLVLL